MKPQTFSEFYSSKTKSSGHFFVVDEVLFSQKSPFQQVDFFRNNDMGVILALDGYVQLTEHDEFFYHEVLVHSAINCHPNPERVLIIGGGDCGTLNQVVKYSGIKEITMVEIDKVVVEGAVSYLPSLANSLDDKRVSLLFEDGFAFLTSRTSEFDVIIVDSTDPETIANELFSGNFYDAAINALSSFGVFVSQSGIPYHPDYITIQKKIYTKLKSRFQYVRFVIFPMPSYSSGMFSCVIATNGNDPKHIPKEQIEDRIENFDLKYYSPQIHSASMALPAMLKKIMFL